MADLRPFQRRFIRNALKAKYDTCVLSLPRGNGKSWLAAHLTTRILSPDDDLFRAGTESALCAASIEQARIVFRFVRSELEPTGEYRFLDSLNRIGITHKATNTKLRVLGSNGKTAMGLVNCPWVIADEPGAWEVNGGTLLYDAIETAKGKPGSPLKSLYIGTLAPATGGWWHQLVKTGSVGKTYVMALQGDKSKWDNWREIRRCNPLTQISAPFKAKLKDERDKALADSRLKARFLSYRLNIPTQDESKVLLTVDDWETACARPVPPRVGRPIVTMDLGNGRAWCAAVGLWRNGRAEALALAPGTPDLEAQEKRDRVHAGDYQRLFQQGLLRIDGDRRVPRVSALLDAIRPWSPEVIIADRFRINEILDETDGRIPVVPRVTRWSEASEDIRALRKAAKDGPLAPVPECRPLIQASLSVSEVKNDDQGNVRLIKRDPANNTARDDVSAALVLAAGALSRAPKSSGTGYQVCG